MKLVCVSNNPFPYHTPILNELNRLVDLHVVYMAGGHPLESFKDDWGTTPEYPYSYHWSRAIKGQRSDFRTQISVGISYQLSKLMPDVILFSSWGPLVWEPLMWKTIARRKAVMWAESTRFSGQFRGGLSNKLRSAVLSSTDAFVANGSQASLFLNDLGVPSKRVVSSCLPSPMTNASRKGTVLKPFDKDAPRLLFVGRFIARKRPVQVVDAFSSVLERIPGASLAMVGDGPLLSDVRTAASKLGDRVELIGRLEGNDLAKQYLQSDILVVPSVREVWGLVVNEALAHGLFVIATDEVGAAHDLLSEDTGMIVPADEPHRLSTAMIDAVVNLTKNRPSRPHPPLCVDDCTPARFAASIETAAHLALNGGTV
jgi:glycosyltransferase involved in cell wall biosynthesis